MFRAPTPFAALVALGLLAGPATALTAAPPLVMEGHAIADVDVESHDALGRTALMRAAIAGRSEWLIALRQQGARLDEIDKAGQTALILAAAQGHLNATRTLVDLGADFNFVDQAGYTALMRATANHHVRVVKALLEEGASPSSRSREGYSAIGIARKLDHTDLLALFHADGNTIVAGSGTSPILKSELAIAPLYGADEDTVEPQTPGEFVSAYLAALKTATGVKDLGPLLSSRARRALSNGLVDQMLVRTAYTKDGAKRAGPTAVTGKQLTSAIIEMARAVNHRKDGDILRISRQKVNGIHATVWYEIHRAKEAGTHQGSFAIVREANLWKLDVPGGGQGLVSRIPAVQFPAGAAWRPSLTGVSVPGSPLVGRLHGVPFKPDHAVLQGTMLQFEQHLPYATNMIQIFLAAKGPGAIANRTIEVGPGSYRAGIFVDVNAPRSAKSLWWYQDQFSGQGSGDYQMRLVCGNPAGGHMPVRLYLCLPDREKSFLAGSAVVDVPTAPGRVAPTPKPTVAKRPTPNKATQPGAGTPTLQRLPLPGAPTTSATPAPAQSPPPPGAAGIPATPGNMPSIPIRR